MWDALRDLDHLYNFKNVENTHGEVLLLVRLLKVNFLHRTSHLSYVSLIQEIASLTFQTSYHWDKPSYLYVKLDVRNLVIPIWWLSQNYLSVFSPNARKYEPEKLWIRTLFTQWIVFKLSHPKLNVYFHTFLWCLRRFYGTTKKCENKNST